MKWRYRAIAATIGFFTIFNTPLFVGYVAFWIGRYSRKYKIIKKVEQVKPRLEEVGRIGIK